MQPKIRAVLGRLGWIALVVPILMTLVSFSVEAATPPLAPSINGQTNKPSDTSFWDRALNYQHGAAAPFGSYPADPSKDPEAAQNFMKTKIYPAPKDGGAKAYTPIYIIDRVVRNQDGTYKIVARVYQKTVEYWGLQVGLKRMSDQTLTLAVKENADGTFTPYDPSPELPAPLLSFLAAALAYLRV